MLTLDPGGGTLEAEEAGTATPGTGLQGFVMSPNEQVGRDPQHAIAAGPRGTTAVA